MVKYKLTYRIVQIGQGTQTRIDIHHGEFETHEAAHAELGKLEPNENQTFTILPIYSFKKP